MHYQNICTYFFIVCADILYQYTCGNRITHPFSPLPLWIGFDDTLFDLLDERAHFANDRAAVEQLALRKGYPRCYAFRL